MFIYLLHELNLKKIHSIGIVCLIASFSTTAYAASFDCQKAKTLIEKEICADNALSKLDEKLAHIYQSTLKNSTNPTAFKKQQRQWLKSKRNKCQTADCLQLTYQARLDSLLSTKLQKQKINPVGQYQRKDESATINISVLDNGHLHVSGEAVLVINVEMGDVRLGTLDGAFPLNNQKLSIHYQDDTVKDGYGCQLDIQFSATKLQVSNDNNQCGGMNVSFNGEYQRIR